MAYFLDGNTKGVEVYIVGFAIDKVIFTESKLNFLSGIAYAIYVAASDLDEEEFTSEGGGDQGELDLKAFEPRPLASLSVSNFEPFIVEAEKDVCMGVWTSRPPSVSSKHSGDSSESPSKLPFIASEKSIQERNTSANSLSNLPPTWDPVDSFSYPVVSLPVLSDVADNLTMDSDCFKGK
jgi:hypothetical protein